MKHSPKRLAIWAAAVGAVSLLGIDAQAQVRTQQDGRAQDANTRVGSGGFNDATGRASIVSPNDIIYNNVTGNRGFRGPIAERDPQAFTGPIGGRLSDAFIRQSSAAPLPYQPTADSFQAQPFFGSTRGVAPPVGSIREGYSGAYTGTDLTPQNPLDMSLQYTSAFSDWRTQSLGKSTVLGTRSNPLDVQPGEMILQGPLEANNQAILFTGSPLYGVRQFQAGAQATDTGLFSLYGQPGGDRFRFDESNLRQMRSELQTSSFQQQSPTNTQNGNNPLQPQGQGNLNQSLESPDNSATNANLNGNNAVNPNAPGTPGAFNNGTNTNQSVQRRSTIATPGQQMAQYDELQRRMKQYENPQQVAIEQEHQFHIEQQRQARSTSPRPAASQPSGYNSTISPNVMRQASRAGTERPAKPLKINSLAEGVRFTGLRGLLTQAEAQMKDDKFQNAVETYDAAQKVAPNNWMIRLGRANAELGGGFYAQASDDIHEAYAYAPALTLGQYDLNAMMQPKRVEFVTRELKALAEKNPNDEMPVFLLAYIAYNTGDEQQAAQYLHQAEQRAHGQDALLKVLKMRWYLPDSAAAPSNPTAPHETDLNK